MNPLAFSLALPNDAQADGLVAAIAAAGFDGLPVFNADATVMMWTSQRGATKTSQLWLADFTPPSDVASP